MTSHVLRSLFILVVLIGSLVLLPSVATAQNSGTGSDWEFGAAVYLWGAGIGGETRSGTEVDVSFSDLVENLEMALMGSFEARKGKWSILTDMIYLNLGTETSGGVELPIGPPGTGISTKTSLDLKGTVFHLAGGYNLVDNGKSRLDLIAGARNLDMETDVVINVELGIGGALPPILPIPPGGLQRSFDLSADVSVWDGIVGLKGNVGVADRWFLPYYADMGTGDSDFTWQMMGGVGFQAASWVDLVLTYRHLAWEFSKDSKIADMNFSGPTFGAIFRF